VIKRGASVPGYKKIQESIIVKIGNGHPHSPAFTGQACLLSNVGEMKIRILVIKRNQLVPAFSKSLDG
jgi:hypothetical protein